MVEIVEHKYVQGYIGNGHFTQQLVLQYYMPRQVIAENY